MTDLLLHLSPCPNDTFMLDAWINKHSTDFNKFNLHVEFHDIKTLNNLAEEAVADITKLSVFAVAKQLNHYQILTSGAAIGYGNGPIIVSKRKIYPDEIPYVKIGIPGFNTTAYALLYLFYKPQIPCKEYFFYEIEEAILTNEVDAGVIIHETRFTFKEKGLSKIIDLGNLWEENYNLPLPLGVFAVKRSLSDELKKEINETLRKSIVFAKEIDNNITDFVKKYAQVKRHEIIQQHIQTYVNDFSVNLNEIGKESILKFINEIKRIGLLNIEIDDKLIFVD